MLVEPEATGILELEALVDPIPFVPPQEVYQEVGRTPEDSMPKGELPLDLTELPASSRSDNFRRGGNNPVGPDRNTSNKVALVLGRCTQEGPAWPLKGLHNHNMDQNRNRVLPNRRKNNTAIPIPNRI